MPIFSAPDPDCSADLRTLEESVLRFIRTGDGSFEALILAAHSIQRALCAAIRRLLQGTSKEPASWREIPAIPLTAFRHAAIRSFPAAETIRSFRTSGTTGEGYGEHHFRTLELYHAAAIGGWQRIGPPDEKSLLSHAVAGGISPLVAVVAWPDGLLLRNAFFSEIGTGWSRQLSREENARGAFRNCASLSRCLRMAWRSRSSPAAGQPCGGNRRLQRNGPQPAQNRSSMLCSRDTWDSGENDIWNEYGMTELSSQFYARGLGNPHRGAPWVRALVIDPESGNECADGETGILRIFDLANIGSCCALQTRDLAIRQSRGFRAYRPRPRCPSPRLLATRRRNSRPMNTAERAAALAQVAENFPLLGKVTADDLVDVVRLELGHPEILDGFRPYAGHFSRAIANDPILHVISGNTPHAGLQSLIRGLLLGAMNFVKLPASGLREVEEFAKMLPPWLKDTVELEHGATRSLAARSPGMDRLRNGQNHCPLSTAGAARRCVRTPSSPYQPGDRLR